MNKLIILILSVIAIFVLEANCDPHYANNPKFHPKNANDCKSGGIFDCSWCCEQLFQYNIGLEAKVATKPGDDNCDCNHPQI